MWLSTPKEGEDRVYHRAGEGTCLLCAKDGELEHRLEPDRGIKGTRVRSLGYKEMRTERSALWDVINITWVGSLKGIKLIL